MSSSDVTWRSAAAYASVRAASAACFASAGATHAWPGASATPAAAAVLARRSRASAALIDSTSEPVNLVRGTIDLAGARAATAARCTDQREVSRKGPSRASAPLSPDQFITCCAARMKTVSPLETVPCAAVATAAQPARAPAAGPAA